VLPAPCRKHKGWGHPEDHVCDAWTPPLKPKAGLNGAPIGLVPNARSFHSDADGFAASSVRMTAREVLPKRPTAAGPTCACEKTTALHSLLPLARSTSPLKPKAGLNGAPEGLFPNARSFRSDADHQPTKRPLQKVQRAHTHSSQERAWMEDPHRAVPLKPQAGLNGAARRHDCPTIRRS